MMVVLKFGLMYRHKPYVSPVSWSFIPPLSSHAIGDCIDSVHRGLEEGWEGRMNIVERGGALQGRMGATRLAQHRTEQIVDIFW
jgi:hypothetical protein